MNALHGNLTALVLDDEKSGRDMVGYFIREQAADLFGQIHFASSLEEASLLIDKFTPQVVFLDIQLKGELGFSLASKLPPNTHIVIVSAYPEYALQAIKMEVVDYLLKPISESDFQELKYKIQKRLGPLVPQENTLLNKTSLVIRESGTNVVVPFQDIEYVEAAGAYSKIITAQKEHLISRTLKLLSTFLANLLITIASFFLNNKLNKFFITSSFFRTSSNPMQFASTYAPCLYCM